MSQAEFLDAAVVLVGHGSSKNDRSEEAVFQQAEELRRRKIFGAVREAFWKQEPKVLEVVKELKAARVFFVPMFVSEGYFSEGVIPKALGFGESRVLRTEPVGPSKSKVLDSDCSSAQPSPPEEERGAKWFYCKAVGTHKRMREVLLGRAREVITRFPFPRAPKEAEITLFVAGHGTVQDENSRKSIEHQAELIRALNCYGAVHAVFLEEEPEIANCYDMAQTKNIVVAPFFIGEGMHVQEDIPILLGEPERIVKKRLAEGKAPWRNPTERKGKLVWYAESVGSDATLAEVILERVKESAGG